MRADLSGGHPRVTFPSVTLDDDRESGTRRVSEVTRDGDMPAMTETCGCEITEGRACALPMGHAGYHSADPDPAGSAWKYEMAKAWQESVDPRP
jgi:hypothetical protein